MALEASEASPLQFLYKLAFADGNQLEFPIYIDKASNSFISQQHEVAPAWAALDYHQCSNCPLLKAEVPLCPVAANLVPLIDLRGAIWKLYANAALVAKRVLSSILGLIMAISPYPHTEYLKPMARFHLPLASEDETIYRTTSMFLLAQYFLYKEGKAFSLELDSLTNIYEELKIIHRALAGRLRSAITEDGAVNSIILLDLLTQSIMVYRRRLGKLALSIQALWGGLVQLKPVP
jgi:hypothetical protein